MKKCPFCAKEIKDEAVFCRYCRRDIAATPATAKAPAPQLSPPLPPLFPSPIEGTTSMGLASMETKRQILESLKDVGGKYKKPFESGSLAAVTVFGGSWNEYAAIVLSATIADTLLDIQVELQKLNANLRAGQ